MFFTIDHGGKMPVVYNHGCNRSPPKLAEVDLGSTLVVWDCTPFFYLFLINTLTCAFHKRGTPVFIFPKVLMTPGFSRRPAKQGSKMSFGIGLYQYSHMCGRPANCHRVMPLKRWVLFVRAFKNWDGNLRNAQSYVLWMISKLRSL